MTRLLNLSTPPTAVLASNDRPAIGALRAARCKGLGVPGDLSVVGFDDIHFAEFTEPPLTTVRLSRRDLAEKAIYALLQPRGAEYTVTPTLVVRESTQAPHSRSKAAAEPPRTERLLPRCVTPTRKQSSNWGVRTDS